MLVFILGCCVEPFYFVFVVCDVHIFENFFSLLLLDSSKIILDFRLKFCELRLVARLSPHGLFHFNDFKTDAMLPVLEELCHLFIFVKNWRGQLLTPVRNVRVLDGFKRILRILIEDCPLVVA